MLSAEICLSSLYLPPIGYFAYIYCSDAVAIDGYENYQKQSYRNRCTIGAANGAMSLSIPIVHNGGDKMIMKDVKISSHGNWQHLHRNAIISAHNSSPYFEYYKDEFLSFYEKDYTYLIDLNFDLLEFITRQLGLKTKFEMTSSYEESLAGRIADMRDAFHPKRTSSVAENVVDMQYYQVFIEKNGFCPNLSIIDLLFNKGNESRLILRDSLLTV